MSDSVRPFRPEDRPALRQLFLDTADAGRPLPQNIPDPALLTDLWTDPYIICEPRSLWIAESAGRVVGYLTGCVDEPSFQKVARPLLMRSVGNALCRRLLWTPAFWRLLWTNRHLVQPFFRPDPSLMRYPGHFHLNLADGYRRQGLGRQLLTHFMAQAKRDGCRGVRAATREDNLPVQRFLESLGFMRLDRRPTFRWTHETDIKWKIIYARAL